MPTRREQSKNETKSGRKRDEKRTETTSARGEQDKSGVVAEHKQMDWDGKGAEREKTGTETDAGENGTGLKQYWSEDG